MKLTPPEIVEIWNALNDLAAVNDDLHPEFTGWKKRFQVICRAEAHVWNESTTEERKLVIDRTINIPIWKMCAEAVPQLIPADISHILPKIFEGNHPQIKPKLRQYIDQQKGKKS